MGRPPLHHRSTNVRLPPEDRARIEEIVGERGMGRFIRDAVAAELDRREAELSRDDEDEQDDSPKPGR